MLSLRHTTVTLNCRNHASKKVLTRGFSGSEFVTDDVGRPTVRTRVVDRLDVGPAPATFVYDCRVIGSESLDSPEHRISRNKTR